MTDTVRDRIAIEQAQHAVGLSKWNGLSIEKRKALIAAIQSPTLTDREIYERYLAIKLEPICPSTSTKVNATQHQAIQQLALSGPEL